MSKRRLISIICLGISLLASKIFAAVLLIENNSSKSHSVVLTYQYQSREEDATIMLRSVGTYKTALLSANGAIKSVTVDGGNPIPFTSSSNNDAKLTITDESSKLDELTT